MDWRVKDVETTLVLTIGTGVLRRGPIQTGTRRMTITQNMMKTE